MNTITDFKRGDKVYFGRSFGEQTLGEVVKVNRVKLKVKQLDARGMHRSYPIGTVWTVPVNLCQKVDAQNNLAGASVPVRALPAVPTRTQAELGKAILSIYCALSPENLTCDGELPMAYVRKRRAQLNRELRQCFRELGRTVSESEAYQSFGGENG